MTDTPRIAHPSEHWFTGGIIQRVRWESPPDSVRLWNGKVAEVLPGDELLVFFRGLPAVQIVEVERGAQEIVQ